MIEIHNSASRSYLIGEIVALACRLTIPIGSYLFMPYEMRLPVVKVGVTGLCLFCFCVFLFQLFFYWRYTLTVTITENLMFVQETRAICSRTMQLEYPLEARCRDLGGGMARIIYVKSLLSKKDVFFGKALGAEEQDELVTVINRGQIRR
jgi:hypothetical protein